MIVKNKIESIEEINKLGLNKFPEQLFRTKEVTKVKEFIQNNPAEYYAIRDKTKPGGIFKLKVRHDGVLQEIQEYNLFTINVSSANYAENQLLVGEIEILSNNEIYAILSTNSNDSVRDAIKNPTFNIKTNIFDNKILKKSHTLILFISI